MIAERHPRADVAGEQAGHAGQGGPGGRARPRIAGLVVRQATGNDLDAVVAVGHRTWLATFEPIAGPEYVAMGLAKWWTTDVVSASIRVGRTLVAELDGAVVGVATFGVQDDEFVLWKLYVLPGNHGHGIGSALMDAVVDRAYELGHTRIVLSYVDGNTGAGAFYAAHGFKETHRESVGSGLPDSIWLVRELAPAATPGEHPAATETTEEQR